MADKDGVNIGKGDLGMASVLLAAVAGRLFVALSLGFSEGDTTLLSDEAVAANE